MPLPIESLAQGGPPILLPPVFDPTGRSTKPRPLEEEKPLEPVSPLLAPEKSPEEFIPSADIPTLKIFVRSIRVVGSTVFSEQQFAEVTTPYLNRLATKQSARRIIRSASPSASTHRSISNAFKSGCSSCNRTSAFSG
jgi:hypothetical protein